MANQIKHIGYKAFDKDLKCRGFQYEIGKTYELSGSLIICQTGFHFCKNLYNVFNYYPRNEETRVCEIIAEDIQIKGDKAVTNKITILREILKSELDNNSGNRNSGDGNSGNGNSGDGNSGYGNSGYGNSGYGNSGNRNSGDWNSGDGNSGYFNTVVPIYLFNKPSKVLYTKEFEYEMRSLNVKPILQWIVSNEMTSKEQEENPSYKVTGGFLRKTGRHDWTKLTKKDKAFIKALPNFNDKIFKEITGVSIDD